MIRSFRLVILILELHCIFFVNPLSTRNVELEVSDNRKACENFSRFVCAEENRPNIFEQMTNNMYNIGKNLLQTSKNINKDKLNHFYKSCTNVEQIKSQSLGHLKQWYRDIFVWFQKSKSIKSRKAKFQFQLEYTKSIPPYHQIFGLETSINTYNTSEKMPQISGPNFYLIDDLMKETIKTKFQIKKIRKIHLLLSLAKFLNETITLKDISSMMMFEARVHEAWKSSPNIGLVNMTTENLKDICPTINWEIISNIYRHVTKMDNPIFQLVQITSFESLMKTCQVVKSYLKTSAQSRILENYLKWSTIFSAFQFISSNDIRRLVKLSLKSILSGTSRIDRARGRKRNQHIGKTRENDCLTIINRIFPLSLSSLYISTFVESPELKPSITSIIGNITYQMELKFKNSNWLNIENKNRLLEKIRSMKIKLLYPEIVKNQTLTFEYYKKLNITENNFFQNIMNSVEFSYRNNLQSISTNDAVDNEDFTAFEINAYYTFQTNQINIPMGILQAPLFQLNMSTSEKYSKLGFVIGHEMVHGFDPIGILFDSKGNLNPMLDIDHQKKYTDKSSCYVEQYNHYNLPGSFELKENIADNIALELAYQAFEKNSQEPHETDIKAFFYSYAKMFCYLSKNDGNTMILVDSHSPNKYRINGPISNSIKFHEVFQCDKDDQSKSRKNCYLW